MRRTDVTDEPLPAPLQFEDIAGSPPEVLENPESLDYWQKLINLSHRDPIDGTDLTNRNLLNSLNTSVEGSSGCVEKLRSLRDSIPAIKGKLGVVQEGEDFGDSFRTPPGSRMPLRGMPDQTPPTSAGRTTAKRSPTDPQTLASKIIDFATAGSGQVDPRTEVTPEVLSEILSQLQQEPSIDDIVDFIRRVKVVPDEKSSTKSTERLTTWLGEKRERNKELETKLAESQKEQGRLAGELRDLQVKTKEMQKTVKDMYEIVNTLHGKYEREKQLKAQLQSEDSQRGTADVQVLRKALFDSEKLLSEMQSQLSLKRQRNAELELKLSQLQETASQSCQADLDNLKETEDGNGELMEEIQACLRAMDELSNEAAGSAELTEQTKDLEETVAAEQDRLDVLRAVLGEVVRSAELALAHKG